MKNYPADCALCEVFVIVHPDIAIHLADILMRQFANFEINQQVAF
jgi:hypothetical protein